MSNTSKRYQLNQTKYLSEPEMERLKHLLKSHIDHDLRNCALLLAALHTGARATELLELRRSDLNEHEESIFIRGIKGSNDREIPVKTQIFRYVLETSRLTQEPGGNPKVFPISYNRLHQIWQLYRPIPKKFHALRHTFAIELYKKTKDIRLVQVALGHRNIMNTMIYADYVYSLQELRKQLL